jgi:hypothetical protein
MASFHPGNPGKSLVVSIGKPLVKDKTQSLSGPAEEGWAGSALIPVENCQI